MIYISLLFNVVLTLLLFILIRGGGNMVDMYVALVIAGRRNITTVPAKFQKDVLEDLNALGLDGYGNPIVNAE